jgi:hypothetical protein
LAAQLAKVHVAELYVEVDIPLTEASADPGNIGDASIVHVASFEGNIDKLAFQTQVSIIVDLWLSRKYTHNITAALKLGVQYLL